MELDPKWIAEYFEQEMVRLRKIEGGAKAQEREALGNVAKYDYLIAQETAQDEKYQRARRIELKKVEHAQTVLANISPRLDKMSEQWAVLNAM